MEQLIQHAVATLKVYIGLLSSFSVAIRRAARGSTPLQARPPGHNTPGHYTCTGGARLAGETKHRRWGPPGPSGPPGPPNCQELPLVRVRLHQQATRYRADWRISGQTPARA